MSFTQQRLFNSSISSYVLNLGLNEQITQLSVNLVDDTRNGDQFSPPLMGTPVYFSHSDDAGTFVHGGLFQHYVQSGGESGSPTYTVDILDPRVILDGIQLILAGYIGATESVPNLINVFGYLESQVFGNALVNDGGIPFVKIRQALNDMVGVASPFLANTNYGGPYIQFRGYNYSLDISELPNTSQYYRIPGNFISLIELISLVCQDHGYDFYCQLIDAGFTNIIKIKTIDRSIQTQLNILSSYIASISNVIGKEVGQELRTDPTSMFLVGAQIQVLYTSSQGYFDSSGNSLNIYGDGGTIVDIDNPEHIYYTIDQNGDLTKVVRSGVTNSSTLIGTFDSTGFLYDGNNNITYNLRDDGLLTSIAGDGRARIIGSMLLNSPNQDRTKTLILPFWGLDAFGNVIIANVADRFADASFDIDSRHWNVIGVGDTYNVTMAELRAALINQDNWMSMVEIMDPDKAILLGLNGNGFFDVNGMFLDFVSVNGRINISKLNANTRILEANQLEFGDQSDNIFKLYSYVKEFAEEYYGRKFMVRVPEISATRESETGILVFSLDIADGGYLEEGSEPIGLPNYYNDLFTDESGKFQAFVRLDNVQNYNLSNLIPGEDYVVVDKVYPGGISVPYYAFIKCGVDPNFVFLDYNNLVGPRAVITLPAPVLLDIEKQSKSINLGVKHAWLKHFVNSGLTRKQYEDNFYIVNNLSRPLTLQDGTPIQPEPDVNFTMDDRLPNLYEFTESVQDYNIRLSTNPNAIRFYNTLTERLQGAISNIANGIENNESAPIFKQPDFVAVPLRDNTSTYGPWYANSAVGKVIFEQDESLAPWNYGGFAQMNLAAQAKLIAGTAKNQVLEAGSITIPGVPGVSVGEALRAGLPNITNIQVSISEQGVTTTYNMQTYTPKFGVLAQQNAQRFTRLTKQSQGIKRQLNKIARTPSSAQVQRRGSAKFIGIDGSRILTAKSPHPAVLARNDIDISGNIVSSSVSFLNMGEGIAGIDGNNKKNFQSTAMMTLDGIFRPFSTASGNDGSHGYMPHFEKPSVNAAAPTVFNLNPFASGDIYQPNAPIGTDIGYVLSGDDYTMQDQLFAQNAIPSSIRGVGLRAPLVLVGWGYDTNGKPVPNVNPVSPGDMFATGYRTNSKEWKAGPLDTRWDNDRKVWVTNTPLELYAVIMHSGGRTFGLNTRPLYVIRPITSITFPNNLAISQLTYDDPTTLPPLSGINDKVVFNMQESWGDLHTLGLGTPVILYNKFGVSFINELPRTFAIRTA